MGLERLHAPIWELGVCSHKPYIFIWWSAAWCSIMLVKAQYHQRAPGRGKDCKPNWAALKSSIRHKFKFMLHNLGDCFLTSMNSYIKPNGWPQPLQYLYKQVEDRKQVGPQHEETRFPLGHSSVSGGVSCCLLAKHSEQQERDARCVSHSDKTSSCLPDATVAALPLQRLPPTDTRVSGPPAFTCMPASVTPSSGFTPNKHSLVAAEIIPGTKRTSRLLLWQFSPPFLSGRCLQPSL